MHILQLCFRVPFPPTDGGAIAMYDVTAGLVQAGHRVTVVAPNTHKHWQEADVLDHLGPQVRLVPVPVDTRLSPWKALKNLLVGKLPYNVERFVSPALAATLTDIVRTEQIDVVQIEGTFVAWYLDIIKQVKPALPVVLRAHNVEYTIWQMLAERASNPMRRFYLLHLARGVKQFEAAYLPRFDAVAAITEPDQRRLRAMGCKEPVVFIPAGVNLERIHPNLAIQPKPKTLFMIGSLDWMPNLEGLDWFLTNVWPTVQERLPDVELHIAGKNPPERLQRLKAKNVFMHGFVESATEFMQQYEMMLVPLLSGGGMRIKIIEGMAMGKCILSTGLGSEGIHASNNEDILVCDEPSEWIDRIERYYHGDIDYVKIGQTAAQTVGRLYDNRRVVERFLELYHRFTPATV
ncbi:glycosyltransferase family 4 protein [Hymenobacter sp. GOD-10R]|uniref:glycosyltransferase family 4 protein n=1 Tax=Hymenobacter sp. GOD-10R TaxID=3093922 RepID=UPI002D7822F3|nr:glycosyltransferase family 4 protein [Hymenobacter sp. GOD-10R]WRQ30420.1 glycosyltransferase family 4 protein [Hymenobacter sp. GOD-10R]